MIVARIAQTEAPGGDAETTRLELVADDVARRLARAVAVRRVEPSRGVVRAVLPRGAVVAPYWSVAAQVGPTDVASVAWSSFLAARDPVDAGAWVLAQPVVDAGQVAGVRMFRGVFSYDLRTGRLTARYGRLVGGPGARDRALLARVLRTYLPVRAAR